MIKFKGTQHGHDLIGFGLSAKNVEQLKLGRPISVWGSEIGVPFDILIFYGETEEQMAADLRKAGMATGTTIVHGSSDKPKPRQ